MTLISLRLDLVSHCLLRDIQRVTWPSYSITAHTYTTYPQVESAIKATLSNIFQTNLKSNDSLQSDVHSADYTDDEHPTLRLFRHVLN